MGRAGRSEDAGDNSSGFGSSSMSTLGGAPAFGAKKPMGGGTSGSLSSLSSAPAPFSSSTNYNAGTFYDDDGEDDYDKLLSGPSAVEMAKEKEKKARKDRAKKKKSKHKKKSSQKSKSKDAKKDNRSASEKARTFESEKNDAKSGYEFVPNRRGASRSNFTSMPISKMGSNDKTPDALDSALFGSTLMPKPKVATAGKDVAKAPSGAGQPK